MAHKHIAAGLRKGLGLVVVCAALVTAGCARSATPMSLARFRDAYIAEIHRQEPAATVKVVAENELEVTLPGGGDNDALLDNAYAFYRQDPAQLKAVLGHFVGALFSGEAEAVYTARQLLLLVRPASYLQAEARLLGDDPKHLGPPLSRPIAGDLIAIVAVDQPTTYIYPPASSLRAALKLDDAAIWKRAMANTRRKLPGLPPDKGDKAIASMVSGEGVSSSMLVVDPEQWDAPAEQVGGPPVVAPVAKDMLIVTHLGDLGGVRALRKMAAQEADDPDGLTQQLFVRRNGGWEVLAP